MWMVKVCPGKSREGFLCPLATYDRAEPPTAVDWPALHADLTWGAQPAQALSQAPREQTAGLLDTPQGQPCGWRQARRQLP